MAMTLPLAIHLACFAQSPGRRRAFILAALTIAAAIPVTISRTGLIAGAIMFFTMVPVWGWRLRYNIAALSAGLIAALIVVKPALFGTLTGLFSNLGSNPAVTVRTERYPLAFHYVSQRPWLGRGTGTWLPPQYQILDNNWLTYLVTNGIIGVTALAALHITGIALAWIALRRSSSSEDRHLCAALISIQLMAIVVAGTFDSMAFTTYVILLAFTLGLCGAVWRLTHPARRIRTSTIRWFAD
jgi:O-antigen ligase